MPEPLFRDQGLTYEEAAHGMQTGVAYECEKEGINTDGTVGRFLKHLRVGVNSSMVDGGAMAALLIKKGLITHEEYVEQIRLVMNEEVARYEDRIQKLYGVKVTLR